MGANLDVFDRCQGPDSSGCHFIPEETAADRRHLGHCPTCRIVIEEMHEPDPPIVPMPKDVDDGNGRKPWPWTPHGRSAP